MAHYYSRILRTICLPLLLLIWAFISWHRVAYGCTPAPPTPWFTEHVFMSQEALPRGLLISSSTQAEGVKRTGITLTNSTDKPFYVLGIIKPPEQPSYPNSPIAFPPNMYLAYKLQQNDIWDWREVKQTTEQSRLYEWQQRVRTQYGFVIYAHLNTLYAESVTLAQLEPTNIQEDGRPTTVALPAPQTATLLAIYDDQLLHLPIHITYTLNDAYVTDSKAKSLQACANYNPMWPFPLLFVFLTLAILTPLFILGRRVNRL